MTPGPSYDAAYAGRDLLSLKCDPAWAEALRAEHAGILPGFYADKRHWISVDLGSDVAHQLRRQRNGHTHALVLSKQTNKAPRAILGEGA